jgi:hypothetical protein
MLGKVSAVRTHRRGLSTMRGDFWAAQRRFLDGGVLWWSTVVVEGTCRTVGVRMRCGEKPFDRKTAQSRWHRRTLAAGCSNRRQGRREGGPVGENAMWAGPESGAQRPVKRIQLKISNNFK